MDFKKMAKDFLHFDKLITPKILTGIFWLSLAFIVLRSLGIILRGAQGVQTWSGSTGPQFSIIAVGVVQLLVLPILSKIWFEFIMVIFKIYDKVTEINEKLTK